MTSSQDLAIERSPILVINIPPRHSQAPMKNDLGMRFARVNLQ